MTQQQNKYKYKIKKDKRDEYLKSKGIDLRKNVLARIEEIKSSNPEIKGRQVKVKDVDHMKVGQYFFLMYYQDGAEVYIKLSEKDVRVISEHIN